MSQLFLFVRPPRPLWPFNGPSTAFWPPLAFCSMAAALRDSIPDLRVMIIDAPALKMGWKSLSEELFRLSPDFVALGEEAVSCMEGLRLAKLAKEVSATVVAGGCFFGNVAREVLRTGLVDVVVHGEGEKAIVEVVQACRSGNAALHKVRGVSFLDGGEYVFTGWREPVANLDDLPFPAFDLLHMQKYGATSRNHPNLVSIELSRGCSHECEFCVLWRQMGRHKANSTSAYLRTKSPERLLEEIRICTKRFGRRYIGWVDPCFNASATVPRRLAELLLSRDIRIGQSAWVRADYVQRDLESGAFESCVRSGLNEIYLGLERHTDPELNVLNKRLARAQVINVLERLALQYPAVCTVGSFIYGTPSETRESLRELMRFGTEIPLDVVFFIPMTSLPGTPAWNQEQWQSDGHVFRSYDFLPHGRSSGSNELDLHSLVLRYLALHWPLNRLRTAVRGLLQRDPRRRRIIMSTWARTISFVLSRLTSSGRGLVTPDWYET